MSRTPLLTFLLSPDVQHKNIRGTTQETLKYQQGQELSKVAPALFPREIEHEEETWPLKHFFENK